MKSKESENPEGVVTADGSNTACTVVTGPDADGDYYSPQPCDLFAARKEAEAKAKEAETQGMKTCKPSVNCRDPVTSGQHACNRREEMMEKTNITVLLKRFTTDNPGPETENPEGRFTGMTAEEVTDCTDVKETGVGSGEFESVEICDKYAALAEAGYTCVEDANCASPCVKESDGQYRCPLTSEPSACTDVVAGKSKEICDAAAAKGAAAEAELEAKKTCQPEFNCQIVDGTPSHWRMYLRLGQSRNRC